MIKKTENRHEIPDNGFAISGMTTSNHTDKKTIRGASERKTNTKPTGLTVISKTQQDTLGFSRKDGLHTTETIGATVISKTQQDTLGFSRKDGLRGASERKAAVYKSVNEDFERACNKVDRFPRKPVISIAPMMDWTDHHCRHFHRQLSRHITLYTEMVTTGALLHSKNADRFLHFHPIEHPVVLQLGGCDPKDLALCAKMAEKYGYDEVNLNVGCPSDRVQNAKFGACLMAEPMLVAQCVDAIQQAVSIPVSVKTRIGIDDTDEYTFLQHFVEHLDRVHCHRLTVHARKAWLQGLSPKENRDIPPLNYARVYQLKQDFSHFHISINGGIKTLSEMDQHLKHVDGVMLGREAYQNPYCLAAIDQHFFDTNAKPPTRLDVIENMKPFILEKLQTGVRLHAITRHMLGLFNGLPGARHWRRTLSELGNKPDADFHVLESALAQISA